MSYTALYRKFRPDTFEDVKGQDHIVTTLKNQKRSTVSNRWTAVHVTSARPVGRYRREHP